MSVCLPACLVTTRTLQSRARYSTEAGRVWKWTDRSEHAGSLKLTCEENHKGWRDAGLFASCATVSSLGVGVDPLHVPLTSSGSFPPFPVLRRDLTMVAVKSKLGWDFLTRTLENSQFQGAHLHTRTAQQVPCVSPSLFYCSLSTCCEN